MPKRSIATERALVNLMPDDVRLGMMLGNAVIHAGQSRNTAYRNRTVGEFIDALLSLGVRLDDPLASIDFGAGLEESGYIHAERDEHGAWEVRGVRRS